MGVVNLGVAGNRLLSDGNSPGALARFDREVLVPPGVTHLVVMKGSTTSDAASARRM